MTGIYKALLLTHLLSATALLLLASAAGSAQTLRAEPAHHVTALVVEGLNRTDPAWIESYIGVELPTELSAADAGFIAKKLLTTGVFTSVDVQLDPIAGGTAGAYELRVRVVEKWTAIPVARAAFGGGTPLKAVGAYDIHTFGQLLTLGAEARQYGTAPPGYILYFRDPRSHGDRYYLGGELWRDFRRRSLYNDSGDVIGALSTNMTMVHMRFLTSADGPGHGTHAWKLGADAQQVWEAPEVFDASPTAAHPSTSPPAALTLSGKKRNLTRVMPTLLYDNIAIDNIQYDGARAMAKAGSLFVDGKAYGVEEVESYYYRMLPADLNLAVRAVAASSEFNSPVTNYFLGGLDTVRGLPDGFLYGTHAVYANIELRQIAARYRYLWVQPAAFVDDGTAADAWSGLAGAARATAGVGVRLAVPQIYRMVLRVDYGWSLGGKTRTQGITAGLNQFFDPYIPLASDPRF